MMRREPECNDENTPTVFLISSVLRYKDAMFLLVAFIQNLVTHFDTVPAGAGSS